MQPLRDLKSAAPRGGCDPWIHLLVVSLKDATAEVISNGDRIEAIAISADGAWAATSSVPMDWDYDTHEWLGPRKLSLFDLRKRRFVRAWQAHGAVITGLAFSANNFGGTIASGLTKLLDCFCEHYNRAANLAL